MKPPFIGLFVFVSVLLMLAGCGQPRLDDGWGSQPEDRVTAFRFRSVTGLPLNADGGWAGARNAGISHPVDQPFRLRIRIEAGSGHPVPRRFSLQYRLNDSDWMPVIASDFPYPEAATPPVAVVGTEADEPAAETMPLLGRADTAFLPGAGLNLQASTPFWAGVDTAGEWSWPLVIRRYGDGPVAIKDGDQVSLRVVDDVGKPLPTETLPTVTAQVPDGHLGGTFIETPGRIGPWEATNGDLYFLMEPTETDNVFMVLKSMDRGATWHEVDGPNRPAAGDLEGVASVLIDGTIHSLHQTSDAVWHHAFRSSDHPEAPDTWAFTDKQVAAPPEPPIQTVSLTARPDGSLVGFFAGPGDLRLAEGTPDGAWQPVATLRPEGPHSLSGPVALSEPDGTLHLAYTRSDGTAWYRQLRPDNTLTDKQQVTDGLGTEEADWIALLPLARDARNDQVSLIFRRTEGTLVEHRIRNGILDTPATVTDRPVIQNAVDSDQAGADLVIHDGKRYVLFIDRADQDLWLTQTGANGTWQPPKRLIDGITAQWVRGQVQTRGPDGPVYGFVYDAGSNGGAGMNRYGSVPLD
ncbi:MAG: sialidase family protein [Opitutales bacterium]